MSTNRYGVDVTYFKKWFDRALKDLSNYKPDELARELARMSRTADDSVFLESEFCGDLRKQLETKDKRIAGLERVAVVFRQYLTSTCAINSEYRELISSALANNHNNEG